ncbi:MAG: MurR/RpiR family transcriptional regulator [Rhizobiales bacterium]|nr:MurR/RpiR family transcriptional regulator [Hyphomicrobiales bacterium]NRB15604.1 MurR/RpiR family transcriptional regulator [Hyphomicrobiales bacterium]
MKPAPATYPELVNAITAEFVALTPQLQKLGRFALDDMNVIALETVTTVAARASVNPSTIVRFAKAFGFDGFSDMQRVFRAGFMENTSSYKERIQTLYSEDNRQGVAGILDNFTHSGIQSLEQLKLNMPSDKLEQAVELIKNSKNVYLLAQSRAYAVANYMYYALSRLDVGCHLADGAGGMLDHQMAQVGADDVVIAISFAPYTPIIAELVTSMASKGLKIISITDSPVSPLAANSAVSFEIQEASEQAFRSLVAPLCLAQSLVVGVGQSIEKSRI